MKTTVPPIASPYRAEAPTVAAVDFHVLLVYENMASALRAAEMLTVLSRKDPDGLAVQLSPWSFAALESAAWRAQATSCVERAHLIVIAACGAVPWLSAVIEDWLQTCLAPRREDRLAVVALFHRPDGPDDGDSPRLLTVQRLAREAGCAFFAPGVTQGCGFRLTSRPRKPLPRLLPNRAPKASPAFCSSMPVRVNQLIPSTNPSFDSETSTAQ